jgi:drug/metabolite transporter (DMT)-like permease
MTAMSVMRWTLPDRPPHSHRTPLRESPLTAVTSSARAHPGYWLGLALIVACALSFGMITTFAHLSYDGGAAPSLLVLGRFAGFSIIVGGFFGATRRSPRLPARNFKAGIVMAVPMMMMSVGYLASVKYISVSLAVILLYSFPLMVVILAAASGRERMTLGKIVVMLAAFGGLILAIGGNWGTLDWRGVAFVLSAALGIAATLTWAPPFLEGVDTLAVNLWTNLWMFLAAALYLALFGGLALPSSIQGWVGFVLATLFYTIGYILFFAGMKRLPPAEAAVMLNIEPIVSIAAATLLLGETICATQWLGVAIMLSALCFSAVRGARTGA